jgi:hypothetical protein
MPADASWRICLMITSRHSRRTSCGKDSISPPWATLYRRDQRGLLLAVRAGRLSTTPAPLRQIRALVPWLHGAGSQSRGVLPSGSAAGFAQLRFARTVSSALPLYFPTFTERGPKPDDPACAD